MSFRRTIMLAVGTLLVIGIAFIGTSFAVRGAASKSAYVQAHGVRREAVIVSVDNQEHRTTHKPGQTGTGYNQKHYAITTSYTANVLVNLAQPVNGHTQTTVHVPHKDSDKPGQSVTVLVDPQDPGYAELPGTADSPPFLPYIFLGVGILLIVAACVVLIIALRVRARRAAY
jgi:hypothetical protein